MRRKYIKVTLKRLVSFDLTCMKAQLVYKKLYANTTFIKTSTLMVFFLRKLLNRK